MGKSLPAPLARSEAKELYNHLMRALDACGKYKIEEKKTCIHVVAGGAAFLGVHPRRGGLRLTLPLSRPLNGDRIAKVDQASKTRYYNDLNLNALEEIDEELRGWLKEAYDLRAR